MCTLTFLPLSSTEYILTSNRDESPVRKQSQPPVIRKINGLSLIFPADGLAGGTWIAAAENNRIACLLNGAFSKHRHHPPYRISRGVMVVESMSYLSLHDFISGYPFGGIEPFTYVCFETSDRTNITEFRWDGVNKHVKNIPSGQPMIWSSAQLYSGEVIRQREEWFKDWLRKNKSWSVDAILAFHRFGGEGDPRTDISMNMENKVKTISITSVEVHQDITVMHHQDLLTGNTTSQRLSLLNYRKDPD